MTPEMIAKEFNKSVKTVWVLKYQYKCSYEELYLEFKKREEVLKECQDLCVELEGRDIKGAFKFAVSAYGFIDNLYMIRDNHINKQFYETMIRVIKHIKDNNLVSAS